MTTAPQTMPKMPTALRIDLDALPPELLDDRLLQPEARLAFGDVFRQRRPDLRTGLEIEVLGAAGGPQAAPVDGVGRLLLPRLTRRLPAIHLGRELGPRRRHVEIVESNVSHWQRAPWPCAPAAGGRPAFSSPPRPGRSRL